MSTSRSSRLFRPVAVLVLLAAAALDHGLYGQDGLGSSGAGMRSDGMELVNSAHIEVELGEFIVPVPISDSNSTISIFTKLFVTVRINEQQEFESRLKARNARLREKILVSLRGTSRDELYERDLTQVKQRLLKAVHEAIEEPSVYRVGFVTFSYNEE